MATTTFNDLITFSRGSNATVTGPNGLIQWAPANLLTNSQDFEAAAWTKSDNTITANSDVSPDGFVNADTATPTGATPIVRQTFTTSAAGFYTASVWLKSASNTNVTISLRPSGAGSPVSVVCAVTPAWQRFTVNLTAVTGVTNIQFWIEQFTQAILLWGAQLELGSTATTYNNTSVRNLLGFSEAFDNAAWSKTNCSIVTGAQANPVNGLFNAQKLMEDTANAEHIVRVNIALPTITGVVYGYSVYAKAAGRTQIRVTDNNVVGATFTLSGTGSTSNISGGVTASISQLADGWYRCFISVAAASVNGRLALYLVSSGNTTYTGDGNSGVYIYGAMLSNSASLDPYVPTPGAAPSSTAYYGPRFDYDPVTLLPRGFLVEEARTNLATYSEQFNDAIWTKTRTSVSVNTTAAPDGTTTADTLVEDTTASNTHVLNRILGNPLAAATYTYSIYAKAAGRRYIELILIVDPASTNVRYATMFDLQTGTITTTSSASSPTATANAIQAAGNGWYRCVVTIGNPSGLRVDVSHALSDTPTAPAFTVAPAYTGDGVSGAFLWGAQLEAGAFATSYIPTIASTVTRSADIATISGSLFSQWYRQEEGAFLVEASSFAEKTGINAYNFTSVNDGTGNNYIRTYVYLNQAGETVRTGAVTQADISAAPWSQNVPLKLAAVYKTNDFQAALNGTLTAADTAGTLPAVTQMNIGTNNGQGGPANGHIRSIRYVPVRAADFQLQQVTT